VAAPTAGRVEATLAEGWAAMSLGFLELRR
jgi:hypothetical protein